MARTRAVAALERSGIEFTVHTYVAESGGDETFGEAVAAALGVAPDRVFKTLVAEADGRPVVAIVPVTRTLSLKALAHASGAKRAVMAAPSVAERLTGYVVGGISPFAHRRPLPVVVDDSVDHHEWVFVSAGQRGLQVEVRSGDLTRITGAQLAPVTG